MTVGRVVSGSTLLARGGRWTRREVSLGTTSSGDLDDVHDDVVVYEPDDVVLVDGRVTVRRHQFEPFTSAKFSPSSARHQSLFISEEREGRLRVTKHRGL